MKKVTTMKGILITVMLGFGLFNYSFAQSNSSQDAISKKKYDDNIAKANLFEQQNLVAPQQNFSTKKNIPSVQPLMVDTDGDGMPDTWETAHSLNINDPKDAWADPDGDKVVNLFEYQLSSDPNSASSPTFVNVPSGGNVVTAITSATAGQVIRVEGGTYNVHYQSFTAKTFMVQGGWNSAFTSRDPQNNPTVFDGQNTAEVFYWSYNTGISSVIVDGVTLTHGKAFNGAFVFYKQGTASATFSMKDCKVVNNKASSGFGGAANIHSWGGGSLDAFIVNSLIVNNDSCGGLYNQTTDSSTAKIRIINCTISKNRNIANASCGYGIRAFTLGTGNLTFDVKNTIDWGNQLKGVYMSLTGGPLTLTAMNSDIDTVVCNGTYTPGAGMISSNPMFVNPSSDFHLASGSPCLNTGIDVGLPFSGSAPDMGAFENGVTGVENMNQDAGVMIYPNPTSNGLFTLEYLVPRSNSIKQIEIYNLIGEKIYTSETTNSRYDFDLSKQPKGTYFLQVIEDNKNVINRKIVID